MCGQFSLRRSKPSSTVRAANDVTRRSYVRRLSTFFRWLVERGDLESDPCRKVRLRRVPLKFPRALTEEQVDHLIKTIEVGAANKHSAKGLTLWLRDLVEFTVFTALRLSEVCSIRWRHVDLDGRTLHVANGDDFQTKSRKDRRIPLSRRPCEVLRRVMPADPEAFVFTIRGQRLRPHYVSTRFKQMARRAGLGQTRFHDLRHTGCSLLAQRGASIEAIRLFAGHSSVTVTQQYMHLSRDVFATQVIDAFDAPGR